MALFCNPKKLQLFLLLVGAVTVIAVLVILFLFNYPTFARERVIEAVVFKNDTMAMTRFKSTADVKNLRVTIYIYNVTNPAEVVNASGRIKLEEIGPFVYHEYKEKELIDNNQTSGVITYKMRKRYNFAPELSIGDPKEMIATWPNIPIIAAQHYLDNLGYIARKGAYYLINIYIKKYSEPAFMTDTVDNLLFSGSKRILFEELQKVDLFKVINPWPLKDNKFGLLYNKNFTWDSKVDHTFTVSAGFGRGQTYKDLNQYLFMNLSSILPYWQPKPAQCNVLRGSDGQFFHPFIESSEKLEVYSPDVCRKLGLQYRGLTTIKGLSVYKYTLDETTLLSGDKYPDNKCYCLNNSTECHLDGLINLDSCVAPNLYASVSHFLYGSQDLFQRIDGLKPANKSTDEPVIYIEPNTGSAVQVKVPIQLNVKIQKSDFANFQFFKDDKPLIVPTVIITEMAELDDDQASMLKSKLLFLDSWFISMVLGGAIIFMLAIIVTATILCMKYRNSRRSNIEDPTETDPLISPEVRQARSVASYTSDQQS